MKTSTNNIKSFILTAGLLFIAIIANSQDIKLSKADQKIAKEDKRQYNFNVLDTILQSKNFVLEANFLENQFGFRRPVTSNLNFIKVDSTKAVLQTGNNFGVGYNGVGGITAEGSIRGLKITKNVKNLSFFIQFTVISDIGIYDVSMTINSATNARATITGLSAGELIYDGTIEPTYNSSVFKGRNSI